MKHYRQHGFTLVEVLCLLLVMGMGMTGVVALVNYGMSVAAKARASAIGLATAVSVAKDATPLLDPAIAADWSYTDYGASFDNTSGTLTSTASGYINGFYVERTETSLPADVIVTPGVVGPVFVRSAHVDVDVFDTYRGDLVASFTTRILRQRGRQ
jgi:Tfp pilus assembly protein PilV